MVFGGSSKKKKYFGINLPIFAILGYRDKVYFAGGGGGKKYGVKNMLLTYKRGIPASQLNEIVNEMDTGSDLLQRMHLNGQKQIVTACSDGNVMFYHLDSDKGVMTFLKRVQTDFTEPPSLNDAKLNGNATIVASGGDDGKLRLWDVRVSMVSASGEYSIEVTNKQEFASHSAPINCVDFHLTLPLVISASDDKSCRVFNMDTYQLVLKLTLGADGLHDLNFKFFAVFFSLDEKGIYTVQNSSRGTSYITQWEMDRYSIIPVRTLKAHSKPISACCISKEGLFLGLGGCDGSVKIVNLRHMQIEAEQTHLDMVVKGVDFTGDSRFLVAGTPESNFDILQNIRPQGKLTYLMKMTYITMLLLWVYLFFIQQEDSRNIQG